MKLKREFFPKVRKTPVPRPVVTNETDVLSRTGSAIASEAVVYGPNWNHDKRQNLIEISDAGPALCFRHILPRKDKYEREGLYLLLAIAYRTTANSNANIRTFSGAHVNLPNSVSGSMYVDTGTYNWISDDCCININSIYSGEKLWIQRVDWEWMSRETVYEDEYEKDMWLTRTKKEVSSLYSKKKITKSKVEELLFEQIKNNSEFAKRCLMMLYEDNFHTLDLASLYVYLETKGKE